MEQLLRHFHSFLNTSINFCSFPQEASIQTYINKLWSFCGNVGQKGREFGIWEWEREIRIIHPLNTQSRAQKRY